MGELWRQATGGIATGDRYLDHAELSADVDGERVFGVAGLQLFGQLIYDNGHGIADELAGTAQGVSNIETTEALRLYELWSQWDLGAENVSLRIGLYDLNSEFDSIEPAALFINPSHGIGPDFSQSGRNGPSIFPATALAARLQMQSDGWTVRAAVLDGVPGDPDDPKRTRVSLSSEEGALLVAEAGYEFASGARLGAGYWRYTADFEDCCAAIDTDRVRLRADNAGAYALAVSPVVVAGERSGGLRMFLRVGEAETRINPTGRYFGAGVVFDGLRGAGDQVGLAFAIAELGEPTRRALRTEGTAVGHRESNIELTYRTVANDWLTLQGDVQFIRHPGMDPSLSSVWIFGLRFEVGTIWER
jgi:porin